ncbi:O-antigen ligase family protein [Bacteroides stercorirosoris]|uniref:O-antigen ligase family protein n=1 Tax=Bacteroides stercorirosoris TaxID=871324 RepID=UPI0035202D92
MLSQLIATTDLSNEDKLNRYDYILFVIVFICPYTDSGVWWMLTSFIPPLSTLGSSILVFALSLYLFQYAYRHHYKAKAKVLYRLILIATIWSLFKFIETVSTIGISEAITVYRRSYILLPSFLLCMSYISSMSTIKMEVFAKLVLKWFVILSVLYFVQCLGVNIFNANVHIETAGGVSVIRNIIGLPPIIPVIFAFSFIIYLYDENKKNATYVVICFAVLFLSFTRNLIATAGIIVILATILYIWKWGIRDKYKLLFYILIGIVFLIILSPEALKFWGNLIDSTINSQLVKEEGTYAFRERLIDKAVNTLERHQCLWTGLGYIRDAPKGEYSFVLGTDTYVAPILWCEGVIGIILRCLPCFFLFVKAWGYFKKYSQDIKGLLALVIITSIVSQIPNYVQTSIFIKFNYTFALLYMIFVYILKSEEEDEETELNII